MHGLKYTHIFNGLGSVIILNVLKKISLLCLPKLHLFDHNYSKICTFVNFFIIEILQFKIIVFIEYVLM